MTRHPSLHYSQPMGDKSGSAIPDNLVSNAILVLGAPRSGTTWLAKIFDSHPDVFYRHEPDEVAPPPPDLQQSDVASLVRDWIFNRSPRTSSKRPFFRKSWEPAPARIWRNVLTYGLSGAARLPRPLDYLGRLPIPWPTGAEHARIVLKSVRWCAGAGLFARAIPNSRTVIIIRHPCAQVSSIMRGAQLGRFELRVEGEMPFDEAPARAHAAAYGVGNAEFNSLSDAAQYAWSWVAFNETALDGVDGLSNTRTILYEDLCEKPEILAKDLFVFAGLAWNRQTQDFIAHSTNYQGSADYYAVVQNSKIASERWRGAMSEADQHAVRSVVRHSRLSRFWPEIVESRA